VKVVGVLAAVPVIRSPFAVMHVLGTNAEAAAAGVRAVVVSVPACARALVERQTIPALVVVAGEMSAPTFKNSQAYTPGEVSETRNQSPLVTTVEEPPGGVMVPGVVAMT
jgi:hypothetical protein